MPKAFDTPPIVWQFDVIQDDNATAVRLLDHAGRFATGSSKRNNGDPKNWSVGLELAMARAAIKWGQEILKENGIDNDRR